MSGGNIGLRTRVRCPFNPIHTMNYSKFHDHFIECQKKHPNDRRKSCPFNFSELIEPEEMEKHLVECQHRRDYGTANKATEDYMYTSIKAPYNISFGPDDEWHRRALMNNDDVDPDGEIDSVSVYDKDVTSRRFPKTDTESRDPLVFAKLKTLGKGDSFYGNYDRLTSDHESDDELHPDLNAFSFLREENIRPVRKETVECSRGESTSSLETSSDARMDFLRKLRADAVNEPLCGLEVQKRAEGEHKYLRVIDNS